MAGQRHFNSTIMRLLGVSGAQASLVRRLVKEDNIVGAYRYPFTQTHYEVLKALDEIGCTKTRQWIDHCLNMPSEQARRMACIDEVLGTYGTEVVRDERKHDDYWGDTVLEYCNTGYTYKPTVCYSVESGLFFISSWGDWVEKHIPNVPDPKVHI